MQARSLSSSQRHACHAAGGVSHGCGTATVAAMARTASPRSATIGARARRAPSRSGLRQQQRHCSKAITTSVPIKGSSIVHAHQIVLIAVTPSPTTLGHIWRAVLRLYP